MSSTGYWAGYSRDGGVTCRVMDRGGQAVTTLEQIAQSHLDADSWADEGMMLAALRAAVGQCAKILDARAAEHEQSEEGAPDYPYTKVAGWFTPAETLRKSAAAIREWAEGKP